MKISHELKAIRAVAAQRYCDLKNTIDTWVTYIVNQEFRQSGLKTLAEFYDWRSIHSVTPLSVDSYREYKKLASENPKETFTYDEYLYALRARVLWPNCGGMNLSAVLYHSRVQKRVLTHLKQWSEMRSRGRTVAKPMPVDNPTASQWVM